MVEHSTFRQSSRQASSGQGVEGEAVKSSALGRELQKTSHKQAGSPSLVAPQRTTAISLFSSPRLGGCPCSQSPQVGENRKK